ncbi:MAG: hypothetical protein RLZZ273_1041 [Bacteroidota bacterium]
MGTKGYAGVHRGTRVRIVAPAKAGDQKTIRRQHNTVRSLAPAALGMTHRALCYGWGIERAEGALDAL